MNPAVLFKSQHVEASPSVEAVVAAVANRREPAVLDGGETAVERGRFTIVGCDPVATVAFGCGAEDPFEEMRGLLERTKLTGFQGCRSGMRAMYGPGWIGYFAYEAGRHIERLPATTRPDIGLPIARFGLYDIVAVHDTATGRWALTAADLRHTGLLPRDLPPLQQRVDAWAALLREAAEPAPPPPPPPARPVDNMPRTDYLRMVGRAKEYIAAGDIFQVNLARRWSVRAQEPAAVTYRRLRRLNPAAYGALLVWGEPRDPKGSSGILSASPELFLRLQGRTVLTRPIKGTRPRSADPVVDAASLAELAASAKDRAELAMIVDLERNDLGRVCEFGSVRVLSPTSSPADPYQLETHPTVHHLVADVAGTLAASRDGIDLLRACFPGGSITGAPKIRAMEIIDELEPTERSVYTGSIGWLGLDGSMVLSIAIRTILLAHGELHVYAGGGIVADSDPEQEYDETTAKALGLCRALGLTSEEAVAVSGSRSASGASPPLAGAQP